MKNSAPFLKTGIFPRRTAILEAVRHGFTVHQQLGGFSLICCNRDCKHQRDGTCILSGGATVSNAASSGCAFYVRRTTAGGA